MLALRWQVPGELSMAGRPNTTEPGPLLVVSIFREGNFSGDWPPAQWSFQVRGALQFGGGVDDADDTALPVFALSGSADSEGGAVVFTVHADGTTIIPGMALKALDGQLRIDSIGSATRLAVTAEGGADQLNLGGGDARSFTQVTLSDVYGRLEYEGFDDPDRGKGLAAGAGELLVRGAIKVGGENGFEASLDGIVSFGKRVNGTNGTENALRATFRHPGGWRPPFLGSGRAAITFETAAFVGERHRKFEP